jgi:hypothetical protein
VLVCRDQPDLQDHKETQAPLLAQLVQRDRLDRRATLGLRGHRAILVLQEHKDQLDRLVQLVRREILVLQEHKGQQGQQDHKGIQVPLLVLLGLKAQQGLQGHKGIQAL